MWSFFSRDPSKEFGYEILEQLTGTEEYMLWKLHKGKKKVNWHCIIIKVKVWLSSCYGIPQGSSEPVSVFILDAKTSGNDTQIELAKAALKRLKTLRHPNILTYIDSLEVIHSFFYNKKIAYLFSFTI